MTPGQAAQPPSGRPSRELLIAAAIAIGVFALLAIGWPLLAERGSSSGATAVGRQTSGAQPTTAPNLDPVGIAAIRPTAGPQGPSVPAFTADDARAYVAAHPIPQAQGRPYSVTRVSFLSSGVVNTQLGVAAGVDDSRLLCVVELHGTFTMPKFPAGPPGPTVSTYYQLFDARTGNLLLETAATLLRAGSRLRARHPMMKGSVVCGRGVRPFPNGPGSAPPASACPLVGGGAEWRSQRLRAAAAGRPRRQSVGAADTGRVTSAS